MYKFVKPYRKPFKFFEALLEKELLGYTVASWLY